jgi:hypothetical protein
MSPPDQPLEVFERQKPAPPGSLARGADPAADLLEAEPVPVAPEDEFALGLRQRRQPALDRLGPLLPLGGGARGGLRIGDRRQPIRRAPAGRFELEPDPPLAGAVMPAGLGDVIHEDSIEPLAQIGRGLTCEPRELAMGVQARLLDEVRPTHLRPERIPDRFVGDAQEVRPARLEHAPNRRTIARYRRGQRGRPVRMSAALARHVSVPREHSGEWIFSQNLRAVQA